MAKNDSRNKKITQNTYNYIIYLCTVYLYNFFFFFKYVSQTDALDIDLFDK